MNACKPEYTPLANFLQTIGFQPDELYEREDIGRLVLQADNGKATIIFDLDHLECDLLDEVGIVVINRKILDPDSATIMASEQVMQAAALSGFMTKHESYVNSDFYEHWLN